MKTNKITHRRVGDYNIPNLVLPSEETNIRLGKWGMLHKDYLHKHKNVFFTTLLTQGKLYQHCAEVEKQAKQMFDTLVEQTKESEGITEQLKEENQMEWVRRVQNIEACAKETICHNIIFK
ncbi:MAG: TnpV protein [Oscillospiraceae bacterium]|nr:TnpV protein [Oscillospiraceae bacterium]